MLKYELLFTLTIIKQLVWNSSPSPLRHKCLFKQRLRTRWKRNVIYDIVFLLQQGISDSVVLEVLGLNTSRPYRYSCQKTGDTTEFGANANREGDHVCTGAIITNILWNKQGLSWHLSIFSIIVCWIGEMTSIPSSGWPLLLTPIVPSWLLLCTKKCIESYQVSRI